MTSNMTEVSPCEALFKYQCHGRLGYAHSYYIESRRKCTSLSPCAPWLLITNLLVYCRHKHLSISIFSHDIHTFTTVSCVYCIIYYANFLVEKTILGKILPPAAPGLVHPSSCTQGHVSFWALHWEHFLNLPEICYCSCSIFATVISTFFIQNTIFQQEASLTRPDHTIYFPPVHMSDFLLL